MDSGRSRQIRLAQTARRALALDDGSYRALVERVTGRRSLAECDAAEAAQVVAEFRRLGWRPRPRAVRRRDAPIAPRGGRQYGLAMGLWRALYYLGEVGDVGQPALARYAARMTRIPTRPDGIERLEWLDADGWDRLIRGLRGWCRRVGHRPTNDHVQRVTAARRAAGLTPDGPGHAAQATLAELLVRRAAARTPDGALRTHVLLRAALLPSDPQISDDDVLFDGRLLERLALLDSGALEGLMGALRTSGLTRRGGDGAPEGG